MLKGINAFRKPQHYKTNPLTNIIEQKRSMKGHTAGNLFQQTDSHLLPAANRLIDNPRHTVFTNSRAINLLFEVIGMQDMISILCQSITPMKGVILLPHKMTIAIGLDSI